MFTAALFIVPKTWKQPKCPWVGEWIKKNFGVLHNGILLGQKKEETLPFGTTWMGLESIVLSEISQSEKDKYNVISLTCGI